jgi:hypothetical protein
LIDFCKYNRGTNRFPQLFIVLFLFFAIRLPAQDEKSIRTIIEEVDLKKLIKADSYKDEADRFIEDANRLNMEVFSVQADPNLDEKAVNKKTGQLESQAQQKQVQASALYEKCNEVKFTVYKKYLDNFWNAHAGEESVYLNSKLLEEQASDNYFQAASYRIDAKRMDNGYAKVEKLAEADNLELQAIQKQLTALGIYYGIGESASQVAPAQDQPVVTAPESTIPANLSLDQEIIDKYNRYITSGQFTDTALSTGEIAGITTFDANRLLQLWYDFMYGQGAGEAEFAFATETDSSLLAAPTEKMDTEIGIVTDENIGQMIPSDEEVIYRVQLAANRSELSQRALSKMYYGNKGVEVINENGWYKYSVGDFDTYEEASKFRQSTGISNAFVVAYRKGTKFSPGMAETEIKAPAAYTPVGEQRMPPGLLFRIQVAASRIPLTMGQFERIYPGKYPVEMIFEEGWFKYQFIGVRLYSDALKIIQNVTSAGAFIVSYEDGTKTNLADAVKRSNELQEVVQAKGRKGNIDEIEYHLQLAASRTAMRQDELYRIYSGPEPVSVILEDGWFKYHLKAGNSSEAADQFKKTCNIEKAFIVPYRRAAKIQYYEAIHETK